MSYISAIVENDDVMVWERNDRGERVVKHYPAPWYFYVDDDDGDYTTMYNTKVSKIDFTNSRQFYNARKKCEEQGIRMWESDIGADIRILSTEYFGAIAPKLHTTFWDIEVDYNLEQGFSSIDNPYAPISAVSMFHEYQNRMVVLCVPPKDGTVWTAERLRTECDTVLPIPSDYTIDYYVCADERELLLMFLVEIEDSDLLCGWNSEFFDMPYMGKRVERVLGRSAMRKLSFFGAREPTFKDIEKQGRVHTKLEISGRISADYKELYEKYEEREQPSYKLAYISDVVLVDETTGESLLPKLEYEGTLASLYVKDFAFFIRYNIRDSEILRGFEHRLGYVGLANQMYHLSTGQFQHVGGVLKLVELSIINHCHHVLNKVVNNSKKPEIDRQIDGAYVLLPQSGLHEWFGSIDITSLYPSVIRALNISPEMLRGQFTNTTVDAAAIAKGSDQLCTLEFELGETITKVASEWKDWLRANKMSISGYGTVFDQTLQGIIPAVLTDWFATRKKYQALKSKSLEQAKQLKQNGQGNTVEYNKLLEEAAYYDRLQYVYKIKLNSAYGALSNLYFRFYDLRMGESTTASGRAIIVHQARKVAEILDGEYNVDFPTYDTVEAAAEEGHPPETALYGPKFNGMFMSESVIAGDTDSTYFKTHATNKEDAIAIANRIASITNTSYTPFVQDTFLCNPGFDTIIKTSREIVSDRGIFVKKKHYIIHLIDKDGKSVDEMKVMGIATKKTTLPKAIASKLNKFIERLLKGDTWESVAQDVVAYKEELRNYPNIMDIGLPKGVNKVEFYTEKYRLDKKTRLPGHVAAAIHYNECLAAYNDKVSIPITSGMKIRVFYLLGNYGKFKSIALPTDTEVMPQWFLDNFKVDKVAHIERLVDKPLENVLKAIGKTVPTKQSLTFDSIFKF